MLRLGMRQPYECVSHSPIQTIRVKTIRVLRRKILRLYKKSQNT
jgi:hypothetical protein